MQTSSTVDRRFINITVNLLPSADDIITPGIRQVMHGALIVIERVSQESEVGPSTVEVDGFVSPDSDNGRLILTQWVHLTPESAMSHWSNVARAYYAWVDALTPDLEKIAREQVGIAVAWDE